MKNLILTAAIVSSIIIILIMSNPQKSIGQVTTCVWPHLCNK